MFKVVNVFVLWFYSLEELKVKKQGYRVCWEKLKLS